MPKKQARIRLNLEFPPDTHSKMLYLQEKTHAASITEVIRRSIELYSLLEDHKEMGGEVLLKRELGELQSLWIL